MRWTLPLLMAWIVLAQGMPLFEINAVGYCRLSLVGTQITDNGDGDGIADTHETLQIGISLQPACRYGGSLNACVAWISTESPAIECMRRSEISLGNLPGYGPPVTPADTFEIKIGNIDRHSLGLEPDDPLEALLMVDIRCDNPGGTHWFQEPLVLALDLNVLDQGQTPVAWSEDFESGGNNPADPLQGTAFYGQNIDAGLPGNNNAEGLANADGWRCQYSDPDWQNANSYNSEYRDDCYPGIDLAQANAIFWQVDGSLIPGTPDGGRAHQGEKSMYYGIFIGVWDNILGTPRTTVESVATHELINLGADDPQLSFWQQISLIDHRAFSAHPGRSLDRGVVQIQLHDSAGNQISDWMNLHPIENGYDQQAENNYFNCMFDPMDDGNDEDDFFDPTDPEREYGPSSTCYPTLSWAFMGSTTGAFSTADVGNATTPPAASDAPSLGVGTWIESKIDLSEFRGRRAKLRFLVSALRTRPPLYFPNPWETIEEKDDGWWIDDIVIDETLTDPAGFHNDLFLLGSCSGTGGPCIGQCRSSSAPCSDMNPCDDGEGDCVNPCPAGEVCSGPPPGCGSNCTEAEVNVFVEPGGPLNPASLTRAEWDDQLTLNFTSDEPSWVDVCVNGHREFRYCISGDPDGDSSGLPDADCDDLWDSRACDTCPVGWSIEPSMLTSADVVTTYAVEVRCSSAPDCRDERMLEVVVECSFGATNTYGLRELRALDRGMLTWRGALNVDWLRGSFSSGQEIGRYLADFTEVASNTTAIPMDGNPPAGSGYYYLVKADGQASSSDPYYCSTKSWRSGGLAELGEPARNNAFGDP